MSGLGDIVTTLTVRPDGVSRGLSSFQAQMEQSLRRVPRIALETSAETNRALGRIGAGGRSGRGLIEVSRALEDFSVSASTGGIAAGLRGAGNNINTLAAGIHPLLAVATTLAISVAPAIYGFFSRTRDGAKEASDALSEFNLRAQGLTKYAVGRVEFAGSLEGLGTAASAVGMMAQNKQRVAELTTQRDVLEREGDDQVFGEVLRINGQINDLLEQRLGIQKRIDELYEDENRTAAVRARQEAAAIAKLEGDRKARERLSLEERDRAFAGNLIDAELRKNPKRFAEIQRERELDYIAKSSLNEPLKETLSDLVSGRQPEDGRPPSLPAVAGLRQGSSEAISAIYAAMRGASDQKAQIDQKQIALAERANKLLSDLKAAVEGNADKVVSLPR